MRNATYIFAAPALALLLGYATHAVAGGTAKSEDICPADVTFKSHVDPKLNALSLEELTAVSDKGDTDAMVLLGMRYTSGELLNYDKAVSLFQKAADKKNADAEFYMAVAYLNGFGKPKDDAQAAMWFRRSADHGHNVGQYWYGELMSKGRGGLKGGWEAALPYFKKAARNGVSTAFFEIGHMYSTGVGGLPLDNEKSAACFRVAEKLGLGAARYNLSLLVGAGKIKPQPGDPQPVDAPTLSVEPKN